MKSQKNPNKNPKDPSQRSKRLSKRLHEINAKGEKELAAIFENIEKAKAAFRAKRK